MGVIAIGPGQGRVMARQGARPGVASGGAGRALAGLGLEAGVTPEAGRVSGPSAAFWRALCGGSIAPRNGVCAARMGVRIGERS